MKDEGGGDVEKLILKERWVFGNRRTDICDCRVAFATENKV